MTYQQAVQFLFEQLPMYQRNGAMAYKNNLNNTIRLDEWLGHPHQQFKSIHVAGTNGKGSVSHMLASIFQEAGYKTGLYTSPHLVDFRERIRINGKMIPKKQVSRFVVSNRPIIEELTPSFFELTVAMAFHFFARENVDIAIVEVGMGGRLDSTNIITPELSIITNIGMDHTAFLGNNLKSIAREKAGIIKHQAPLIVGRMQPETHAIFEDIASQMQTSLVYANQQFSVNMVNHDFRQQLISLIKEGRNYCEPISMPLLGKYQLENLQTVAAAVDMLISRKVPLTKKHLISGVENVVANTSLSGRWQILNHRPTIICDTGHNEDGLRIIMQQLSETPHNHLHLIIGMVDDKDTATLLKLLPTDATVYFTKASNPRSLEATELQKIGNSIGLNSTVCASVPEALKTAKKNAEDNDLIFIGGSTFVVADIV